MRASRPASMRSARRARCLPSKRRNNASCGRNAMPDDIHEIYAIKYGHHDRRAAENYIGGDPHDVNDPLDFFVWAIVGPSGTIVVDTGFDAAMAKKRNRALLKPIAEGLKSIDIAPDKVANV